MGQSVRWNGAILQQLRMAKVMALEERESLKQRAAKVLLRLNVDSNQRGSRLTEALAQQVPFHHVEQCNVATVNPDGLRSTSIMLLKV